MPKVSGVLRFGRFELDLDAQELSRDGRVVHLQPQPFKLLCLLVTQAGRVVTREQIRAALWTGDTFVDFDQGVNYAIRQVRDALGEDGERPAYILTVPRRGYRFIAPVKAVGGEEAVALDSPTQELTKLMWANISELRVAEQRRQLQQKRIMQGLLVGAIAIAIVVLVMVLLRP